MLLVNAACITCACLGDPVPRLPKACRMCQNCSAMSDYVWCWLDMVGTWLWQFWGAQPAARIGVLRGICVCTAGHIWELHSLSLPLQNLGTRSIKVSQKTQIYGCVCYTDWYNQCFKIPVFLSLCYKRSHARNEHLAELYMPTLCCLGSFLFIFTL